MADSIDLIMAQISFLEPELVVIHIPIELYSLFLQPVLQILFADDHDQTKSRLWTNRHDFLNVSITPEGCSVVCTRYLAQKYFVPMKERYTGIAEGFEMVDESYIVIQVDGQGLDAGRRVVELTSPLAMAGISIFFITTYFSDFILVPSHARRTVSTALEQRGFVFSESAAAFVSQLSPASPRLSQHRRDTSLDWISPPNSRGGLPMPSTPPAKDVPELERRTFSKLRQNNIKPIIDREQRLLTCAGNDDDASAAETLKNDLLQVLISTSASDIARTPNSNGANGHHKTAKVSKSSTSLLSITMTADEPVSLFIEARLLDQLGRSLLGNKSLSPEDVLVPITFDLRALPMEATGIVCGVAGCLAVGETGEEKELGAQKDFDGELEITFLSMAKAGIVLVKEVDLDHALAALDFGMREMTDIA